MDAIVKVHNSNSVQTNWPVAAPHGSSVLYRLKWLNKLRLQDDIPFDIKDSTLNTYCDELIPVLNFLIEQKSINFEAVDEIDSNSVDSDQLDAHFGIFELYYGETNGKSLKMKREKFEMNRQNRNADMLDYAQLELQSLEHLLGSATLY